MAYPFTHLIVAIKMMEHHEIQDTADFILGSIAPDAVHYRNGLVDASMTDIGKTKKISHLCPVSNEAWGACTDNEGWTNCVKIFLEKKSAFRMGYATHVLTDIYNNKTIWNNFRNNYPDEAKKGYKSVYYDDLRHIDMLLKNNKDFTETICEKLIISNPVSIEGLVNANEVDAIKQNMLYEISGLSQNSNSNKKYETKIVSYDEMLIFIEEAALFSASIVF